VVRIRGNGRIFGVRVASRLSESSMRVSCSSVKGPTSPSSTARLDILRVRRRAIENVSMVCGRNEGDYTMTTYAATKIEITK
jgi:hypothetical protein